MDGFNCLCKCARYFSSFSRNDFRSETVHLLLRIILESFKLHYLFLTSNTCDESFALRTQVRSDASSSYTIANLDARDFLCEVSGFAQFFIVSGVPTFALSALSKPTFNLFSRYVSTVGSKRQYHSSRVWMSPEETVVVFVQCVYTDVPKTSISSFRNRFLWRPSTSQDPFALRQLLWLDFST